MCKAAAPRPTCARRTRPDARRVYFVYIYKQPQSDFLEKMNSILLRMVAHSRNSEHFLH